LPKRKIVSVLLSLFLGTPGKYNVLCLAAAQRVRVPREGGSGREKGHEIIADERKQASEINLPISAACC